MRISARALHSCIKFISTGILALGIIFLLSLHSAFPASAQTIEPSPVTQTATTDYRQPNMDANVPQNNHTYTQAVVIDVLSAIVCNLTGLDPTNPSQPCLGINPTTGKLGYPGTTTADSGQSLQLQGGAIGSMSKLVGIMYTPTVSSSQYIHYLSSNFGIVKTANAQAAPAPAGEDCNNSQFGYGFCGLQPIFSLWVAARDFAYALLVIAFIFLGVGVMLRFKMDARTVMTLQNQIPRVIIAILLITFSYAIAGIMIDLMWTVTYAGVNAISQTTTAVVRQGCTDQPGDTAAGQPLGQAATNNLLDNPLSFANRIYLRDCEGVNSGVVNLAGRVSDSFILLMHSIIFEILGWDVGGECSILTAFTDCVQNFFIWVTDIILILIITITLFIALFRLWFELIKSYVTFFIFVILGPIWIVFGLSPGHPLGFQKWLRLIFANLAAYPLVAFILVFARVLLESVQPTPLAAVQPNSVFVPPLVGNPNATAFGVLMAFGAVLIAPTIPSMIRERMGAGKNKFGPTIAAGLAIGAGAATAPAVKTWSHLNRHDSHGNPRGVLAIGKANLRKKLWDKTPLGAKFIRARQNVAYRPPGSSGGGSHSSDTSGSSGSSGGSSGSGGH